MSGKYHQYETLPIKSTNCNHLDGDIFQTIPTFTKTNSLLCFHKLLCLGCMTSLVLKLQKHNAINEIDPFFKTLYFFNWNNFNKQNMIFWEDISLSLYNDIKISIFSQGQIRPKTHQLLWNDTESFYVQIFMILRLLK